MIPIILCGAFAVYIIVNRLVFYIKTKKADAAFEAEVLANLDTANYAGAEESCNKAGTPSADVAKELLKNRRIEESAMKELAQVEMDKAVTKYEHLLAALGTIANIATMLGLLGTVTGNIRAFGVLGGGGTMGDPAALANAIAEALVTTVGGLCVSIPSIICHNLLNSMVSHRINDLESFVTKLVFKLTGKD